MTKLKKAIDEKKLPDAEVEREVYEGRKGNYVILEYLPAGRLRVKYVSGEWKGKTVEMNGELHKRIQENIRADKAAAERVRKEMVDDLLDIWYAKYPNLYMVYYEDNMEGEKLLELLETEYPINAENVKETCNEYF